jgi:hypothetical protein
MSLADTFKHHTPGVALFSGRKRRSAMREDLKLENVSEKSP